MIDELRQVTQERPGQWAKPTHSYLTGSIDTGFSNDIRALGDVDINLRF